MSHRLIVPALAALAAAATPAHAAVHRFHADYVLGTSFDMTVTGADAAQAAAMRSAALDEIARLDRVLSGWRDDSELAALNRSEGPLAVSPDLFQVIAACEDWRARTGGAFSARLGAVEAAWRQAAFDGQPPAPVDLASDCARAQAADVRLDLSRSTVDRAGVVFAPDALAKGYIVDAALAAARAAAPSAKGVLLDIGGDLRAWGAAPDGKAWRVGVAAASLADNQRPTQALALLEGAVATSGAGARDHRVGARAINHTLDPATGQAAAARTVTVVAETTAEADPLATALGVLPLDRGLALTEAHGAQARIVEPDGTAHTTGGWTDLLAPAIYDASGGPPMLRVAALTPVQNRAWPAGFGVAINYTIPPLPPGGRRPKPPYVAIWISDEAGKMVRTLYHLGNRPRRFLDSNYVWYRAFSAAGHEGELDSVTRPSRMPGSYTAVWDGKNDDGVAVPQGRYVINIEISREHGGHSLQQMRMTLGGAPAQASAPAQEEAGPASASYGRQAIGAGSAT